MIALVISLLVGLLPGRTGYFSQASAEDLGVHGKLYEIAEEDVIAYLKRTVQESKDSGEMAKLQDEWKEKTQAGIRRPKDALKNISGVAENKVRYFDPTIELQEDLKDHRGVIFARKGTRVNPLEKMPSFNKELIFIDGDDKKQTRFALERAAKRPLKTKIILVRGNIIDLMEDHQVRIYFDQSGTLVKFFGLSNFPSVINKEKNLLKIEEVRI